MLTAIIVAAGSSRRMGFDKLLALLDGKPVIQHTYDAFCAAESVSQIIIVTRPDRIAEFSKLFRGKLKLQEIVAGGERRQDSVEAGLRHLKAGTEFVAVHDAARPLVTPEQIERICAKAREHGAATLAEAVSDTLKRANQDFFVTDSVDREQLFAMQTPQIFRRDLLEKAYRMVAEKKLQITDEVSSLEQLGQKVALVPADDFNFKITQERDLRLAEMVLQQRAASR